MYDFGPEELSALEQLFNKKKLYRYSTNFDSECDLFEKEFSQHFNVQHSLLLSSGTNALIAALLSLGIRSGDEVIVPMYTFFATVNAVLNVGATPILVQNNSELGYHLEDLQSKISEKTKAVIVVHMDGLVTNILDVKHICDDKNIFLIEDAAQALGAAIENKKLGTIGHIGCFSLNENKVLTCGEGGILVTNSQILYEKAHCIHDTPSQFSPSRKKIYKTIKPFVGHSMRVSEIHGAIMRVQLKKLENILQRLRSLKKVYREKLPHHSVIGFNSLQDCSTSIHLKLPSAKAATTVAQKLVSNGIHVQPLIARPAHVAWKWYHLINESLGQTKYSLLDFTDSIELITSMLKFDLNLEQDIEHATKTAHVIRDAILISS